MHRSSDLDTPLLRLTPWDSWNLGDAFRHTLISGDSGSGKTSGSGAAIRKALLKCGAGALVLVAKPEEADLWRQSCKETGRLGSLIEFDGRNGHGFNFLAYELARQGTEGINSVVECLMRVVEASRMASASTGRGGEQFWEDTTRQLLRHTVPVLQAATGTVTIPDIIEFIRTAPRTPEELSDAEWRRRSFFFATLMASETRLKGIIGDRIISYWQHEFCALDPKTRGNIAISLTTTLDRFNHGWMSQAFCGATTLVPELCFHGAVILLDMPALTLNEDGVIGQILFKYIWQRAMLARNAQPERQRERPCFLWVDEYQTFMSSFDPQFLSACRGSRVATVLLSQSLPTLMASMPGEHARDRVNHLTGLCATKVWHSTSCVETATWAAQTVGRVMHRRGTYNQGEGINHNYGMGMGEGTNWGINSSSGSSVSSGPNGTQRGYSSSSGTSEGGGDNWNRNRGSGTNESRSWGYSEQMDYRIEPGDFGRVLKTGGRANGGIVTGIWYQSGQRFQATGDNTLHLSFRQ